MASLPTRSLFPKAYSFTIRSKLQARNYAAVAGGGMSRASSMPMHKSLRLSLKEQAGVEMPNDVGLLPGMYFPSAQRFDMN
jgi:hypothetical protein